VNVHQSISERFRQNASLAAFADSWSLEGSGERDFNTVLESMRRLLGASQRTALVHFEVREGGKSQSWTFKMDSDGCTISSGRDSNPDLEVLVTAETWWRLVSGELTPVEAFGTGEMRVIGDLSVARRVAARLQRGDKGE
jgi:putative sterol carrier protein